MGGIDSITWYAMGLMLTVIGLFLSYRAYQRKGLASGMRGVAWSLLPLALALTRTLKLAGQIVDDVSWWAAHFVFSPVVWVGLSLGGVSLLLFVVSGRLGGRAPETAAPKQVSGGSRRANPVDDEMADIEAILRKHGIQ